MEFLNRIFSAMRGVPYQEGVTPSVENVHPPGKELEDIQASLNSRLKFACDGYESVIRKADDIPVPLLAKIQGNIDTLRERIVLNMPKNPDDLKLFVAETRVEISELEVNLRELQDLDRLDRRLDYAAEIGFISPGLKGAKEALDSMEDYRGKMPDPSPDGTRLATLRMQ